MARNRSTLRAVVALTLVALGSLALATIAPTAGGISTTITIAPKFQGVVTAAAPCQVGRTVVVKKIRRPGAKPRNKVVEETTSGAGGVWSAPSNRQFGRYFAVARRSPRRGTLPTTGYGYGSGQVCERGESDVLDLGSPPGRRRRRG